MTETIKTCIQCNNTYSSEMFSVRVRICDVCRENNKIKRIERQKQWKLNNPEKLKAYAQTYKNANADSIKEKRTNTVKTTDNTFIIANYADMILRSIRNRSTRKRKTTNTFYRKA